MYSNLIKPSGFGLIHPSDPTTHGSAKFLTHREISRSALAQPNGGPCVGFAFAPARGNRDTLAVLTAARSSGNDHADPGWQDLGATADQLA